MNSAKPHSVGALDASSASFYIHCAERDRYRDLAVKTARLAVTISDGVTLAGPGADLVAEALRTHAPDAQIVFDPFGYALPVADPRRSIDEQRSKGAARVLTPGRYVPYKDHTRDDLIAAFHDELELADDGDVTPLIALDAKWVSVHPDVLRHLCIDWARPVAFVLAHSADPFNVSNVAANMRMLAESCPPITLLRSDHGGLVVAAYGAGHVSFGVTATLRHWVPPGGHARPAPDDTPRLFVLELLDWFRGSRLALMDPRLPYLRCKLPCCNAQRLSLGERFLDPAMAIEARWHSMQSLAKFASLILEAPDEERHQEFRKICEEAASRYHDYPGGPTDIKPQMKRWILS